MKTKTRNDATSQLKVRIDKDFRKAENILKQNHGSSYAAEYDLVKSMKGRRKEALLNTWSDFVNCNGEDEWMMLNLLSKGINGLESEGCILFAASIWVLDTLYENGLIHRAYPMFPKNYELFEKEIATMATPIAWDGHYEFELIAGIEYILYKRNSEDGISRYLSARDFDPLLITPNDAAGKKNSTSNRMNFNKLMKLIPLEKKDLAANHFKEVFTAWVESYFDCIKHICQPMDTLMRSAQGILFDPNNASKSAAISYQLEELQEKKGSSPF